jgi:Uma2 family endonuclease
MSSTTTPQPVPSGLLAVASFFRLTVDEYHEMIRNNILTTDDRVELLDGYLVNKMPQNSPHASCIQRLTRLLSRTVPVGWAVRIQLPVTLARSEPEPDGAVVRGVDADYDGRQAIPSDFGIIIEVSDSSLALDRREKGRLYAEANIPVYWVINVLDRQVEVYTSPNPAANPPAYATRVDYTAGQAVPFILDGLTVAHIAVGDLIP